MLIYHPCVAWETDNGWYNEPVNHCGFDFLTSAASGIDLSDRRRLICEISFWIDAQGGLHGKIYSHLHCVSKIHVLLLFQFRIVERSIRLLEVPLHRVTIIKQNNAYYWPGLAHFFRTYSYHGLCGVNWDRRASAVSQFFIDCVW